MPPTTPTPPNVNAPPVSVGGSCDTRFARVRDAFASNFVDHDEIGACLCVQVDGRRVVDLWGGHRDAARRLPWQRDTLVNAYSVGKGVLAIVLLSAVERGEVDLDAPVARYWPEFGAAGKHDVTVRILACHAAGLPAVRERLPADAYLDWSRMCGALAAQAPYWTPGEEHGYHVNTFGFLVGELIRRAGGERVGEVLARLVAETGEPDFRWGLPAHDHARAAEIVAPQPTLEGPAQWARAFPPTGDAEQDFMVWHTYFNPPGLSGIGSVNTAPWRSAVIPSTNGHGTARAVAALYATLLAGAARHGGPWPSAALVGEATRVHRSGPDRVLGRPSCFGVGFQLPQEGRPIGRGPRAFGHYGYGGALGFADPDACIAFGYLMNRPGDRWQTPRTQRLIDAVYDALG